MNQEFLKTILSYFNKNYKKHKLLKIQRQFKNDDLVTELEVFNLAIQNLSETQTNYEIIAQVQTQSHKEIKEFTFDKNGSVVSIRTVEPSSYEHVLY